MKINAINGFKDILPEEVVLWQRIENCARDIFRRFCFEEIRLPILEKTELFARSIGESTDIVEKEMYTFPDKGITMRPEATASLLRSFIENGLHVKKPVQRLFTLGPMFRHERPQKGRLRQFHQIDVEIIGAQEPLADAELMAMGQLFLKEIGLHATLEINSLGCPSCRPTFRNDLVSFLGAIKESLCDDCKRRTETNPLRVLDCKKPTCSEQVLKAPSILDSLCNECNDHFQTVQSHLSLLGVDFKINRFMVRGLDYYTRTTFEFTTDQLGSQSAIGAGGRYDGLIEQLGGPKIPGIGFAMGMERLTLLMQEQQSDNCSKETDTDFFIAALGVNASKHGILLVNELRKLGKRAVMDYSGRSLKAQMKQAGRFNAFFTVIIGENELESQKAILRNMKTQDQRDFSLQGTLNQQCRQLIHFLGSDDDCSDLFQSIQI